MKKFKKYILVFILVIVLSICLTNVSKCSASNTVLYINAITNQYGKSIETQENLLPTYIDNEITLAQNRVNSLNKTGAISFGFITDIHADNGTYSPITNIKAFTKFGNSEMLKFGICAGDITTGLYGDLKSGKSLYNLEYYANMLRNTRMPVLLARGNHDCNTRSDASIAISGEQYYESVLKQLDGEVTFDSNNLGGDYYYKDLEDEKIRVCVLNAFNGTNYEFIFGNKQLEFVANEMLDFTNKENPQDWQVIFLTHTVDSSVAHTEVPSDNEKLYKIINAFQQGEKNTIGNISVDYTNQGKGTIIAIITGHHHLDSTTIKDNILIITVRSASALLDRDNRSEEKYNEEDISFDIFSIDKENKILYATKVGRGDNRCWSYDINNLKENGSDENNYEMSNITDDYINVGTMVNHNNEVIAIVTSNVALKAKSNQTWKLSEDKKTYIKILNDVSDGYTTTFTNINGYSKTYTFKINDIKDMTSPKLELKYINNDDGTITAKVTSNEILQTKGNTDWKLAENRKEYTYTFTQNRENYNTEFKDMFQNGTRLTLNAKIFEPNIEYIQNEDKTITVKVTSKTQFVATKPTWTLSEDGHTYTKTYTSDQNYSTAFTNVYGKTVNKSISINALNIDVEISYKDNGDGTITAIATSKNNKFSATKPTWTLSEDRYTYTKIYETNQNYSTVFTNVYGKTINKTILINKFSEKIDVEISYKDNGDGTITAIAVSKNNKFANTKPTWKLSEDGYTYTKIYTSKENYSTNFTNIYGNSISVNIKI